METFRGYHSEWNLGSPGGWDYQRITQVIGKAAWEMTQKLSPAGVDLDFDHPLLYPVNAFVEMLVAEYRKRSPEGGLLCVVAEEETLESVTENKNLARRLNAIDGVESALCAPQSLELHQNKPMLNGRPVGLVFMDFNTDVLLDLHRKHDLSAVLELVALNRVINPRGTEPINVKSMFEIVGTTHRDRFHPETVARTPWTRQFFDRKTIGPKGEEINNLVEWTRKNWENLVLKPERGYSGHGVRVGGVNPDGDAAVALALEKGEYIVQEKVPFDIWTETIPLLEDGRVTTEEVQTDFRCLMGPGGLMGFLGRFGGVPTNVGSGGGVQPLAVLRSDMPTAEAAKRVNEAICEIEAAALEEIIRKRDQMAVDHEFTYLLGPIRIALRPRILTEPQLEALQTYAENLWTDCMTLEKMWLGGELDHMIQIEPEELAIARMQPWGGSAAVIASDGLFGFHE